MARNYIKWVAVFFVYVFYAQSAVCDEYQSSHKCSESALFGGTSEEKELICLVAKNAWTSARSRAEILLNKDPNSFRGWFVYGSALYQGDRNLPKALYALTKADNLFTKNVGMIMPGLGLSAPDKNIGTWMVLHRILLEKMYVQGDMDLHAEKLTTIEDLRIRLGQDYRVFGAWSQLKLKQFDKAREVAWAGINSDNPWFQEIGRTALCAVESELRNRVKAYEACKEALKHVSEHSGAVEYNNAASAALELFHFDESEKWFLKATEFPSESIGNPWGRLARLYLREGRYAEALSAWRQMVQMRRLRLKSSMQSDDAENFLTTATLFLLAGKTNEAVLWSRRAVEKPDRQGSSSSSTLQNHTAAILIYSIALRAKREQRREELPGAPIMQKFRIWTDILKLSLEIQFQERQVIAALRDQTLLVTTLRPECPGSLELPTWMDFEVPRLVGKRAALLAIAEGESQESLNPELSRPLFDLFKAEAYASASDWFETEHFAAQADKTFNPLDVLLRARANLLLLKASNKPEVKEKALGFVLRHDPSLLRLHDVPIPIKEFQLWSKDPAGEDLVELLKSSPRFRADPKGVIVSIQPDVMVIRTQTNQELRTVFVRGTAEDKIDDPIYYIAQKLQESLFEAPVDLTQGDMHSLDGSLGSGIQMSKELEKILRTEEAPKKE